MTTPLHPRKILFDILVITGYDGDKELYITQFLNLCQIDIVNELFERIPPQKQEMLANDLKAITVYEDLQDALKKHFAAEEISIISSNVTQKLFGEVLQKVLPTLTNEKKEKLKEYFKNLV